MHETLAGSTGAALLAELDRALHQGPMVPGVAHDCGFDAAIGLDHLLSAHGGWMEACAADERLGKLCGRLGSAFEGERVAAYGHAQRHLAARRAIWSSAVHLPPSVACATYAPPPPREPCSFASPDGDWAITLGTLLERDAGRDDAERDFLKRMRTSMEQGLPLSDDEARRIRDIWWWAELNEPPAPASQEIV